MKTPESAPSGLPGGTKLRLPAGLAALWLLAGCGSWSRVGSAPPPSQDRTLTQLFDLPSIYRRLGRLAAGAPLPFVGSVSFVAGGGDSTTAIVAVSLESHSLVFTKEGKEFVARYRVDVTAQPAAGGPAVVMGRDEVVRVGTFQETLRSDESVLFQQALRLTPGGYHVVVGLRDRGSAAMSRAEGDYVAPAFSVGSLSSALVVYQVRGRAHREDPLSLIVSPRGTVAYGGDSVLAYVEGYRLAGPRAVPFELRTEEDSVLLRDTLLFEGGRAVEGQTIRFSPDSAPLGELRLVVGEGEATTSTSFLVSFSQAWLVTNLDEMLSLLRYFGEDNRLSALRKASTSERPRLWREFWHDTDPNQLTPQNEALDEYFQRLAAATARFRDEGVPGWRTDRGEVFIGLGEPDEVFDASPTSQGRIVRWSYRILGLTVFFQDESGFGRFRLTPASRAEFERVLGRLRRQAS